MNKFDVGGESAGVVGHLLFELLNIGDFDKIDVELEGLFFGRCFEK